MNGQAHPATMRPPPAYTDPQGPPPGARGITARSFKRIGFTILALGVGVLATIFLLLHTQKGKAVTAALVEQPVTKAWKPQSVYPPAEEKAAAVDKPARDPNADRLAALERQQQAILQALQELKNRKQGTSTVINNPAQEKAASRSTAPLYIVNKLDGTALASTDPEYILAPGATKLACVVETAMNSDASTYFTARTTTNVYDTATGQHLLVPQGSTILGNGQGEKLIYGNERLNTVSLTLTLPDARTVDIGDAPVTDQQGIGGLADRVDQHYGRLFAATFITLGLKMGAAVATNMATGDSATIVTSATGPVSQAGTRVTGPMLNTRPTIEVDSGHLCQVVLLKPLKLPAMWQGKDHAPSQVSTKGGK